MLVPPLRVQHLESQALFGLGQCVTQLLLQERGLFFVRSLFFGNCISHPPNELLQVGLQPVVVRQRFLQFHCCPLGSLRQLSEFALCFLLLLTQRHHVVDRPLQDPFQITRFAPAPVQLDFGIN